MNQRYLLLCADFTMEMKQYENKMYQLRDNGGANYNTTKASIPQKI